MHNGQDSSGSGSLRYCAIKKNERNISPGKERERSGAAAKGTPLLSLRAWLRKVVCTYCLALMILIPLYNTLQMMLKIRLLQRS